MQKQLYLILHNIRSVYNTASIFRTADGAGVKKIFLTGYTPKPTDEFGKIRNDFKKISLSAEKTVEWEYVNNVSKVIKKIKIIPPKNMSKSCHGKILTENKNKRILVVGLEQSKKAINYKKLKPKFPLTLIVGNEVRGIPQNILKKCDAIIEIPMRGKKESLNVSVAASIAIYEILK